MNTPNMPKTTIYEFQDYKLCLGWMIDSASEKSKGVKSRLADFMGSQPAYLSRVLNGDADLTLEQGEAATRFFVLNKAESLYFLAVLGENRAGTPALKKFWLQQKETALSMRLELEGRIRTENVLSERDRLFYFSQWYHAAIHAAIGLKHLQTPMALANHFRLDLVTVVAALEFLTSIGLIQKKDQRYIGGPITMHLEKNSPLVGRHHLNWKVKAMESITEPRSSDVHYTSVITVSKDDWIRLREIVFSAVESMRSTVSASGEEVLACYQFDLFELNHSSERGLS
jgi:uncharacterized protein (TIGR02147 family)